MKKIIVIIAGFTIAFSVLAGCSKAEETAATPDSGAAPVAEGGEKNKDAAGGGGPLKAPGIKEDGK